LDVSHGHKSENEDHGSTQETAHGETSAGSLPHVGADLKVRVYSRRV
jgi:hypothetical protein